MKIVKKPLTDLHPPKVNVRRHTDKQIAEYVRSLTIAGDFEETMSTVEALSGATADEMTTLGEKAKQLGATTKFTAQEAAEAMTYMGMAGWDAQQMVAGMDGVLNLAAAAGEDLALTSDIVTDNLTAFGMAASETGRFADVLAAAATNSNTSVSVMGETFKNSAAIAGTLGYSIEDVAVATGLMANAGLKGSAAGTALKNTFNGLLAGVTITGKALGEYEFTAVRADGTMKSFSDTIEELQTVFDQLSDAEKVQNAQAIAGQRTYVGLLDILKATNEDYAKLSNSINNCTGAAQRMAAVKLDNMNGQLTLMNSAYDALKTTLGEQFTPVMRELYKVGADVFGVLNDFVQKHPGLVKAIAAFIAVLGGVALALGAYSVAAKVAAAASTLLAASIPGLNIILGVTAVVAGLTAAIVGFVSAMDDGIPTVEELTTAAADMQKTLDEARTAYSDIATETEAAASLADQYITRLEEMEREYGDAASEQLEYHNVLALLCQTVPELADYIDLTNNTIEGGTEALRRNTEEWRKNAMAQAYQEQLTKMYAAQAQVMLEAEQNSIKLTAAETKRAAAEKRQAAIMQEMADMEKEWADQLYAANEVVTAGELGAVRHTEAYQALVAELDRVSMEQAEADKTAINLAKAMETDAEAVEKAKEELALAQQAIDNLTGSTQASVEVQREAEQQTQRVNDAINNTLTQVLALTEAYDKAYEAAYQSVSGQYSLWDEAEEIIATSIGNINKNLEGQIAYWDTYNTNLEKLRERTADIEGLQEVIASFADGSSDSVNAIAGMAKASDEDLAKMVKNYQDLQKAQGDTSQSIADLQTDFSNQMDQLQQNLADDVKAMNLGDDAKDAGRATIQGFIDGANGMLPQVQAAYARLGEAATAALKTRDSFTASVDPAYIRQYAHYASGTSSAREGYALVGEYGPELVYMGGGEKVTTAASTPGALAALADRGGATITITLSPAYTITGSMDPEQLESVLEAHDAGLRDLILETVAEAQDDARRSAYK